MSELRFAGAPARRQLPWKLIGQDATSTFSASDALIKAGLDWHVTQSPLKAEIGGSLIDVVGAYATAKIDQYGVATPLGVVGSRYKIIQNQEMFSALDKITQPGDARYTAAGEIDNGRIVYMVMELPQGVNIPGDPHEGYLIARTSHDGSTALEISTVISRLFCTNQMTDVFRSQRTKGNVYTLRHTTNAVVNADRIQAMLQITLNDIKAYESFAERAVLINFNHSQFEIYLERVFPLPENVTESMSEEFLSRGQKIGRTRALNMREAAWQSWLNKTETMGNITGTAFGAYHAVIEAYDHLLPTNANRAAERMITGADTDKKSRALQLLGV